VKHRLDVGCAGPLWSYTVDQLLGSCCNMGAWHVCLGATGFRPSMCEVDNQSEDYALQQAMATVVANQV
jgi:hypothetical protein